jgi:cathepsin X
MNYQARDGTCQFDADAYPSPSGSCMTCATFGVPCMAIEHYPNATVTEYGTVTGEQEMMNEIYARGPIACGVNAAPLVNFTGGQVFTSDMQPRINMIDHEVSVVGWGVDANGIKYWEMRNSWGEYWAEMGFARIERGSNTLKLEQACDWAVGSFATSNFACFEGGENCQ